MSKRVSCDGHVTCFVGSLIRPKVVKSVHYCPATKKTLERHYTDLTSLDPFPSSSAYPTKVICDDWKCNILIINIFACVHVHLFFHFFSACLPPSLPLSLPHTLPLSLCCSLSLIVSLSLFCSLLLSPSLSLPFRTKMVTH